MYEGIENFRLPGDFNHSIMIFLPKKASGSVPNLGDDYLPENTRPLSIVGAGNRIRASAIKFCLHDFLEKWVSKAQQGFLNGRSAHCNILQAECTMQ
eukprot:14948513-Alexandrium_andersonii.AAC.1